MSFDFRTLRERKLVQWTIGYAGAAWLVLQIFDVLKDPLALSTSVFLIVAIVLAGGLPITLLLAWYHGEKGRQRVSGAEVIIIGALLAIIGTLVSLVDKSPPPARLSSVNDRAASAERVDARSLNKSMIAVFPFAVRGATQEVLNEALASLLSSRLDGAGELTTLDPNAVFAHTKTVAPTSPDHAVPLAVELRAGAFVVGDAVVGNDRLQVRASLYETDAVRELARASAQGSADSIFAIVDSLAVTLLTAANGGDAASSAKTFLPTRSLPALRQYLEGERIFREGQFAAAADAYEEAVALDTTFALALYRLSVAAEWAMNDDREDAALERGLRLAHRLPVRERLLIAAAAARGRYQWDYAEQLYREMTERYTQDFEGWMGLGETLFHGNAPRGRRSGEARVPLERAFALAPKRGREALFHLVAIAGVAGRRQDADSLAALFLDLYPTAEYRLVMRAQRALASDDAQQLTGFLREVQSEPAKRALFMIDIAAHTRANLSKLERASLTVARGEQAPALRAEAWQQVARFEAARGRLAAMESAFDEATMHDSAATHLARARVYALGLVPITRERMERTLRGLRIADHLPVRERAHRHYLAGRISARLGDFQSAGTHANAIDRLRARAGADSAVARSLAWTLRAYTLALTGRPPDEVLRTLDKGGPYYERFADRLLKGEVLARTANKRAALAWLAAAGDAQQPHPAYVWLKHAQLSDELGDTIAASESYELAVAQMDSADSELEPVVRAARLRLNQLRRSSR